MARCKYLACRQVIVRLEGTDTWVREGTITADGMAGEVYCTTAPEQIHEPLIAVTVELHPGHYDRAADWAWCEWDGSCGRPAWYLVAGDRTACDDHVAAALENALKLAHGK